MSHNNVSVALRIEVSRCRTRCSHGIPVFCGVVEEVVTDIVMVIVRATVGMNNAGTPDIGESGVEAVRHARSLVNLSPYLRGKAAGVIVVGE